MKDVITYKRCNKCIYLVGQSLCSCEATQKRNCNYEDILDDRFKCVDFEGYE